MKIVVTPNREYADEVRRKIRENDGYCPCKLVKSKETKCMCKEFLEQGPGECHCGLYIKKAE